MDLSALTLQQLRYLVALDDHRSFREAAGAAHVSQPALSGQIMKVEELLGLRLFERARHPIVPTERGARVVALARTILGHIESLGAIASQGEALRGPYRFGVLPTLTSTLMPLLLPTFVLTHPGVELEVREVKTDSLIRELREGSLDGAVAITPLDIPSLQEQVVLHERLKIYLPPGHPLTLRERIHQSELFDEHVWLLSEGHCFRTQVLHLCRADRSRAIGGGARLRFEASSFEALIRLVDAGMGLTILPDLVVRTLSREQQTAQVRPFAGAEPVRQISLIQPRERPRGDVGDALLQVLTEQLPAGLLGSPSSALLLSPLAPPSKKAPTKARKIAKR